MFERILLTLDGSQLAEVAIPYAQLLAAKLGSELVLLHVCSAWETDPHVHEAYLNRTAEAMRREINRRRRADSGFKMRAEILSGEPAEVIHRYVRENAVDLVVMASRGSSGVKDWPLGSVADKTVRAASVPVLLVRARGPSSAPAPDRKRLIRRMLVPLDGSDASKASVPYALDLASRLKASIVLFGMAEKASQVMARLLPYRRRVSEDYAWMDAEAEKEMRSYLTGVEREIRQKSVPVSHVVTRGMDAAYEILEQEKKTESDLVVMATRGRSPVGLWSIGSVAEKVLRQGELPLLLLRGEKRGN